MRRRMAGQRGAAVVELAVVMPLLALLLFGIIQFGRAYSAKVQLTAGVREGARIAAFGGSEEEVAQKTKSGAAGIDPDTITVTSERCERPTSREDASVTAVHVFDLDIPFFGRRPLKLEATGVMRCFG